MKKITITLAVAIVAGVVATPASAVVFGQEVESASTEYPWVASIWFAGAKDDYYYPICSGSLIAKDAILTAAHCLEDKGTYLVQMGSDTLDGGSKDTFYEVATTWKHPLFDKRTLENDVGLIKLTTFQTEVKPVAFATEWDRAAVRITRKFELLGWGNNQHGEFAKRLGYTKLKSQTLASLALFGVGNFDPQSTLAAGRYIKRLGVYAGAGDGDSGGPLVASINGVQKVVGITSHSDDDDSFTTPTVFTSVAHYHFDIAKALAMLERFALASRAL